MNRAFYILMLTILLVSCDDGDITYTEFDFDQTLELCSSIEENQYLFYNTNDSNEAIALKITTSEDLLLQNIEQPNFAIIDTTYTMQIDSGVDQIVYRKFNGPITGTYFCNIIPPSEPSIQEELISFTGDVSIRVTGFIDDNDGIPAELEDPENYNSLDLSVMKDTDDDGVPDIYDSDDDNDNIPTIQEGVVLNDDGTAILLADSRDSDGDGILDYLENDDDDDGVLTINEDANGDLNPLNDNSDPNSDIDDYRNPLITNTTLIEAYREHSFYVTNRNIQIVLNEVKYTNDVEIVRIEEQQLGVYSDSTSETFTFTPEF